MGKHLVLVGGGHAHMTVLMKIHDFIKQGHSVTLVSPGSYHYYSGMGPGMLSGIYQPRELRFNIRKMSESRGATFLEDRVKKIDPMTRLLHLEGGGSLGYDVVSFNTGSDVLFPEGTKSNRNIIPVKPITNLYTARRNLSEATPGKRLEIVVVGGGPAGVEVAGNAWRLIHSTGREGRISLISSGNLLDGFPDRARSLVMESLAARDILVREGTRVEHMGDGTAVLSDGTTFPCDMALLATGVKPSSIFVDSGFPTGEDGGLLVGGTLQSVAYPEIFGGGDCICLEGHRLRRIGVHAVKQNPILYSNLMAFLGGGILTRYAPGTKQMLILNMGDDRGIVCKGGWVWNGRLGFRLKDAIDRRFMRRFQVSGERDEPNGIP